MKQILSLFLFVFLSLPSLAGQQQVTPEMMAQFMQLPPAQQRALAVQYGIDPDDINPARRPKKQIETRPTMEPRELDYNQVSQRPPVADVSRANELQPFGYNVFAGEPLTDVPVVDMPVSDDYVMGPGDEIRVQLYGKQNAVYTLMIGREGFIDFPNLGPISAAGQTFQQLRAAINGHVKEKMIGVESFVSFGALRTMQVFVMGDAYRPGAYNVNGMATVTQALHAAGGIDTVGSLRKIQVKRGNKKVIDVDLYKMLIWGDTSQDIRLRAGDTIFIPAKGSEVRITGLVKRPAIYELQGSAPLNQVLELAGGLKATALQEVSVERHSDQGMRVFNLNLSTARDRQFTVRDGDAITVKPTSTEYSEAVVVKGAVVRDGVFSYQPGMRISRILQNTQRDLLPSTDLNYALVVRENTLERGVEVLQFNLAQAIAQPGGADDLPLMPRDQILIFADDVDNPFVDNELSENKAHFTPKGAQDAANYNRPKSTQNAANYNSTLSGIAAVEKQKIKVIDESTGAETTEAKQQQKQDLLRLDLADRTLTDETVRSSRQILLAPVIERLKAQASQGKPVKIAEVRGEVKYPGVYPLTRTTRMRDLIVAAGGLKEQANIIELSRVFERGESFLTNNKHVDLRTANSPTTSPLMQSKDSINVLPHPEWRGEAVVQVFGEVKYPGTYTVRRGESLRELLQRAGGITPYAATNGAIFSREALRQKEEEQLALLRSQLRQEIATMTLRRQTGPAGYNSSPTEAMSVVSQLDETKAIGRMTIDMPALLTGNKEADVMLQNGDKLYVPTLQNVVSIMGMVQHPSSHIYNHSLSLRDYISKAGGAKKQADTDRTYVIRADGSVVMRNGWFSSRKALEPGDTIIVPIDTDYLDNLSIMTSATQIMYQLGVAWSAIK